MKTTERITGIAGIIILLFSLVWYSIQGIWDTVNWVTLILGLAGSGYFAYTYYNKRERGFSARNLQQGSNALLQTVIVIGIVALLAFITTRRHYRSDLTENKLYSLSDQTGKLLSGLEKEVSLLAFYKSAEQAAARDLLDEYSYRSDKLEYRFVDPDEDPQLTKSYSIRQYNTVVVEAGARREMIGEMSEANLTNAIIKVTREQQKMVYFLTGHGERSISDESPEGYKSAADAVKTENYLVRELNLVRNIAEGRGIPDSCTVLAIIRPTANFFPGELDSIQTWLDNGGKALIMLDPEHPADLADMLAGYKLKIGNDMVVDASGVGQLFGAGPAMPLVTDYDRDIPITKDFSVMTFYPMTCSVTPMSDAGEFTIKKLLQTSAQSWAETEIRNEVRFDEGKDIAGPVTIAALVEKDSGERKTTLAVFGDSDFAKNGYFKNQGNADLILNTVNYLAEEEDMISIRPKDIDDRRLTLTQADVSTVFWLVIIVLPLAIVIAGVVIYVKRNK